MNQDKLAFFRQQAWQLFAISLKFLFLEQPLGMVLLSFSSFCFWAANSPSQTA
jgi:hypothetical protein